MAQTSTEIIGNPIKIGKLEVAQFDFPQKMNWHNAKRLVLNWVKAGVCQQKWS